MRGDGTHRVFCGSFLRPTTAGTTGLISAIADADRRALPQAFSQQLVQLSLNDGFDPLARCVSDRSLQLHSLSHTRRNQISPRKTKTAGLSPAVDMIASCVRRSNVAYAMLDHHATLCQRNSGDAASQIREAASVGFRKCWAAQCRHHLHQVGPFQPAAATPAAPRHRWCRCRQDRPALQPRGSTARHLVLAAN